ncbi:helix-turn-helix transcriptional regulator [Maribacter flavus]|uniref:Helix-turn-helix transcriptional regulator n=2 Tax=Maribacter flavus TaxID=1658664 RepID=A0A5B2TVL0_9FLAO|nr:helix-turn-helix transcriptional regulator [Maribacter flavus]
MDFGARMKLLLADEGLSQKEFAEKVNMNYAHANKFFTGRTPNMEFISKVLEIFPDVNLKWLLFAQGERTDQHVLHEANGTYKRADAMKYVNQIEEKLNELKRFLAQN